MVLNLELNQIKLTLQFSPTVVLLVLLMSGKCTEKQVNILCEKCETFAIFTTLMQTCFV